MTLSNSVIVFVYYEKNMSKLKKQTLFESESKIGF